MTIRILNWNEAPDNAASRSQPVRIRHIGRHSGTMTLIRLREVQRSRREWLPRPPTLGVR